MINNMIELLAPAKDKICAKAAIDFGADAIYIGASEFGARKNAPNSLADIEEIVQYAHKFNVKVYAAVNTILTDEEIKRAEKLIEDLSKIGIDAIIIQDMGLLSAIKANNICCHASTQCDNTTAEKVKFLESIGFSRVILARELSIEQIREIKKQTNLKLEAFIHGALCVSYSGKCYLSYAIGGRSANKGECAQPCRKKYSLIDEKGNYLAKDRYLLNLKDFNASNYIKELAEAGVTSFKIEGRLKDENYVKNVVAYYRKLIDDLDYQKTSSGKILFDFEPDLNKSFNRGFTDYFLEGKRKKCFDFDSPKSKGEYIGEVTKIKKDNFEITSPLTLHPSHLFSQDGLCFMYNGEIQGCLVNKVENNKIFPNKMNGVKIGTKIYRNLDSEFEKKLKNSKTQRKIGVNLTFESDKITAVDEDGNITKINYAYEELAKNSIKAKETIIKQLKKSGDSDFEVEDVTININKMPFLPVSKLNELRRELLEKLMKKRLQNYSPIHHPEPISESHQPLNQTINYQGNILNKKANIFYEKHGCKIVESALENGKIPVCGKIVMTTKHCLKSAFNMCKSSEKMFLVDEKGKKYSLKFNCDKCEMEVIF